MTATWPSTRTGKRLAACPGRLPVGGEQERLPDGSLTELRMMTSPEIAVAIESEATAAAEQRLRERIEELQRGPFFPGSTPVEQWAFSRGFEHCQDAVLAILDAATEPSSEPTWPTREDFRRMSSVEVNAFFASIGSDWRVADFPAPSTPLDVGRLARAFVKVTDSTPWVEVRYSGVVPVESHRQQLIEAIAAEYESLSPHVAVSPDPETEE